MLFEVRRILKERVCFSWRVRVGKRSRGRSFWVGVELVSVRC